MAQKRCVYCRTVYLGDFHIGRYICQDCKERTRAATQGKKRCSTCRISQPIHAFGLCEDRDARDTMCKPCRGKYVARQHGRKLYRDHKITRDTYEQLLGQQESRCAICRIALADLQAIPGRNQHVLHVDHNHQTGQIRGLLCQHCNHGLGCFQDSPTALLSAIQYLARAEERCALSQSIRKPIRKPAPQPKPKRVPDYGKLAKSLRLIKQRQQESV
jgi:Recombination endonuclease VII